MKYKRSFIRRPDYTDDLMECRNGFIRAPDNTLQLLDELTDIDPVTLQLVVEEIIPDSPSINLVVDYFIYYPDIAWKEKYLTVHAALVGSIHNLISRESKILTLADAALSEKARLWIKAGIAYPITRLRERNPSRDIIPYDATQKTVFMNEKGNLDHLVVSEHLALADGFNSQQSKKRKKIDYTNYRNLSDFDTS